MKEIGVKPRELLSIRIVEANAKTGAYNREKKKRRSNTQKITKKEHYADENA